MLSGARALNGDHIYTLASVNANAAVIKGVLKQGKPEQLTVTWREWHVWNDKVNDEINVS